MGTRMSLVHLSVIEDRVIGEEFAVPFGTYFLFNFLCTGDDKDNHENECPICLDTFKNPKTLKKCKHKFCTSCIDQALKVNNRCSVCKVPCGKLRGNQPHSTMTSTVDRFTLPGHKGYGTIIITYHFPSGIQTAEHPNPGQRYSGTDRVAYLPDSPEGREVLQLLRKAFDAGLVFTVGTSVTSGFSNQTTWNDVHHKTSTHGGPTWYELSSGRLFVSLVDNFSLFLPACLPACLSIYQSVYLSACLSAGFFFFPFFFFFLCGNN